MVGDHQSAAEQVSTIGQLHFTSSCVTASALKRRPGGDLTDGLRAFVSAAPNQRFLSSGIDEEAGAADF